MPKNQIEEYITRQAWHNARAEGYKGTYEQFRDALNYLKDKLEFCNCCGGVDDRELCSGGTSCDCLRCRLDNAF